MRRSPLTALALVALFAYAALAMEDTGAAQADAEAVAADKEEVRAAEEALAADKERLVADEDTIEADENAEVQPAVSQTPYTDAYGQWPSERGAEEPRGFCMFYQKANGGYWKLSICSDTAVQPGSHFHQFGSRGGKAVDSAKLRAQALASSYKQIQHVEEVDNVRGVWRVTAEPETVFYCRGDADGVYVNDSPVTKILSCSEADLVPKTIEEAERNNLCMVPTIHNSAEAERALCNSHNDIVRSEGRPRRVFVIRPTEGKSAGASCTADEKMLALDYTNFKPVYDGVADKIRANIRVCARENAGPSFGYQAMPTAGLRGKAARAEPMPEPEEAVASPYMAYGDDMEDTEFDGIRHMYVCVNTKDFGVRVVYTNGAEAEAVPVIDFQYYLQSQMNMNCVKGYKPTAVAAAKVPAHNMDALRCDRDRTGKRDCWCDSPESCCCATDYRGRQVFRSRAGFSTRFFPSHKHTLLIANAGEQAYCTLYMMCGDFMDQFNDAMPVQDTVVTEVPRATLSIPEMMSVAKQYPDRMVHNGLTQGEFLPVDESVAPGVGINSGDRWIRRPGQGMSAFESTIEVPARPGRGQ